MKKPYYDLIIIGAGPAGSTAAYYAAKNKKLKILIIDRYNFPNLLVDIESSDLNYKRIFHSFLL